MLERRSASRNALSEETRLWGRVPAQAPSACSPRSGTGEERNSDFLRPLPAETWNRSKPDGPGFAYDSGMYEIFGALLADEGVGVAVERQAIGQWRLLGDAQLIPERAPGRFW